MWSILPHGEEELKGRGRWLNEVETRFIFSSPKNRHQRKTKAASWCDITVQAAPTHIHFSAPFFYSVSFSNGSAENHTNLLIISTHRNWPKKQQPNRRTKKAEGKKLVAHSYTTTTTTTTKPGPLSNFDWEKRDQTPGEDARIQFNQKSDRKKKKKKTFPVDRSGLTELVKRLSEKEVELISI